MSAHHHDLVLLQRIGPWNLGDGVVSVEVFVVETRLDVDFKLDIDLLVHEAGDAIEVFGGHDQGQRARLFTLLPRATPADADHGGVEAGGFDGGENLLAGHELAQRLLESEAAGERARIERRAWRCARSHAGTGELEHRGLAQLVLVVAIEEHGVGGLQLTGLADQDDGALEFALPLFKVGLGLDASGADHLASHRAVRARRPRLGKRDQGGRLALRGDHGDR